MAYKYTLKLDDFEIIMEVNTLEELIEISERLSGDGDRAEGDDGWIAWNGGDCPVADGTKTEMKFRTGVVAVDSNPEEWKWAHSGQDGDIIAYRIVKD